MRVKARLYGFEVNVTVRDLPGMWHRWSAMNCEIPSAEGLRVRTLLETIHAAHYVAGSVSIQESEWQRAADAAQRARRVPDRTQMLQRVLDRLVHDEIFGIPRISNCP